MAHGRTYGAQIHGLETHMVTIEVDTSNGLYSFSVVGLGDKAVDESKDRVSSAIKNSGYQSPKQKNQKLVISLAPADMRKEGPSFDLGMALAYLLACGDIDFDPEGKLFLGELALGRICQEDPWGFADRQSCRRFRIFRNFYSKRKLHRSRPGQRSMRLSSWKPRRNHRSFGRTQGIRSVTNSKNRNGKKYTENRYGYVDYTRTGICKTRPRNRRSGRTQYRSIWTARHR